jgi:hypothetical protein
MAHHDCRLGDVQRQSVDGWGNWGFAVLPNVAGGPAVSLTYETEAEPGRRSDGHGDRRGRDGNPRLNEARGPMIAVRKAHANAFAESVASVIAEARSAGAMTLQAIADALNARGIATATGKGK